MRKLAFILLVFSSIFWSCDRATVQKEVPATAYEADSELVTVIKAIPEISDPLLAIDSARKTILLARDRHPKTLAQAYLIMGTQQKNAGEYDSAHFYYDLAFEISQDIHDLKLEADYYRLSGVIYRIESQLLEAFENFKMAAHMYDTLRDSIELAKVYNSIGILFNGGINADYPKALEYFNQSARIMADLKDSAKLAFIKVNIAHAYRGLKQYDSTIHYLEESIAYQKRTNNVMDLSMDLRVLSQTYTELENIPLAIKYGEQALELSEKLNKTPEIVASIQQLGNVFYKAGQYTQSLDLARRAMKLEGQQVSSNKLFCYSLLHINYNNLQRPDSAYKYLTLYTSLKDSIQSDEKAKKIVEMELAFETERKDAQIKLLTAEQEIGKQKLARQQQFQIGITLILVVLLAFSVYVIYTNRQKHKMEEAVLIDQMSTLRDLVWKLSREHTNTVEVGLESLNQKLVMPLTSREMEVLELVLSNHTNQEISDRLFISVNTVKFHLKNIYEKMAVTSRREVVDFVIESSNSNSDS